MPSATALVCVHVHKPHIFLCHDRCVCVCVCAFMCGCCSNSLRVIFLQQEWQCNKPGAPFCNTAYSVPYTNHCLFWAYSTCIHLCSFMLPEVLHVKEVYNLPLWHFSLLREWIAIRDKKGNVSHPTSLESMLWSPQALCNHSTVWLWEYAHRLLGIPVTSCCVGA